MEFTEKKYYDIFREQAEKHPDKPAVVMGSKTLTYSEFIAKIDQVSSFLAERGVKSGDHVVLWGGGVS
ncbi:MAG: AMP-binding protein [Synergistaceae bacterium]|nr:AMP-binding protein [Synergistaceae bacterium]